MFTALFEAAFTAHNGHHAPHAGRPLGSGDVQFPISRTLSLVAMMADVVGAAERNWTQYGEQFLGPFPVVIGAVPALARVFGIGIGERRQQSSQHGGTDLMEAGAGGHLDGLQIQALLFALRGEDYLEKLFDLACDFLMNSKSRFFSCSVQRLSLDSTGRRRQISSFTAVRSATNSCRR